MRVYVLALFLCLPAPAENLLSNQPGASIPAGTWTQISPGGLVDPPLVTGFDNLAYNGGTDRACGLWERKEASTEQDRVFWCYSVKENRWDIYAHGGVFHDEHMITGGHSDQMLAADPTSGWYYLMGGPYAGSNQAETPDFTWLFDPIGMYGRMIGQTTAAQTKQRDFTYAAERSSMVDPTNLTSGAQGGMVITAISGGSIAGSTVYDMTANAFQTNTANATIAATGEACLVYNSLDQSVYMLFGVISGSPTANIWKNHAGTWTALTPAPDPTNGSPLARNFAACAFNQNRDHILVVSGCNSSGGCSGSNVFTDTWILDLTTNYPNGQWALTAGTANSHTAGGNSPIVDLSRGPLFNRAAYFPEDDLYVVFTPPNITYAFREDPGNTAGYFPTSYPATQGLNRSSGAWARESTLSANGGNLLAGWIEQGSGTQTCSGVGCSHPNVSQFISGSWVSIPNPDNSQGQALVPTIPGTFGVSGNMGCAWVSSNPWCAFNIYNNGGSLNWVIYGEEWNGASWTTVGGAIGVVGTTSHQATTKITSVNNVPTLAFTEDDRTGAIQPYRRSLYVKQWNGSTWGSPLGGGKLNRLTETSGNYSRVEQFSIVPTTGANFCVGWTEYLGNNSTEWDSNPQAFVSCWNGTSFAAQGGAVFASSANDNFYGIALTYLAATNTLYVAFNERAGNAIVGSSGFANLPKVYVMSSVVGSGAWTQVGSTFRNRDIHSGWATNPSLDTDGTNVYLAFDEQGLEYPWEGSPTRLLAGGTVGHVYVEKWDGSSWSLMGGALNQDPVYGSATAPKLVVSNGNPAVLYEEVKPGTQQQIYVKQWNGTDWGAGGSGSLTITTTSLPAWTTGGTYSQTLAASGGTPPYVNWAIASGSLPAGTSLNASTGVIGGTVTGTPGTSIFSVQVTDSAASPATASSGPLSVTINAALGITTPSPLTSGTVGAVYLQTLAATGGTGPLIWDLPAGLLPPGLALSAGGTIGGTPTQAGPFSFTVRVTDAASVNHSQPYLLTIAGPGNTTSTTISGSVSVSGKATLQ